VNIEVSRTIDDRARDNNKCKKKPDRQTAIIVSNNLSSLLRLRSSLRIRPPHPNVVEDPRRLDAFLRVREDPQRDMARHQQSRLVHTELQVVSLPLRRRERLHLLLTKNAGHLDRSEAGVKLLLGGGDGSGG